jgi:hypothetical protein
MSVMYCCCCADRAFRPAYLPPVLKFAGVTQRNDHDDSESSNEVTCFADMLLRQGVCDTLHAALTAAAHGHSALRLSVVSACTSVALTLSRDCGSSHLAVLVDSRLAVALLRASEAVGDAELVHAALQMQVHTLNRDTLAALHAASRNIARETLD